MVSALVLRLGSREELLEWRRAMESVARVLQARLAEALSQLSALSQRVSRQGSAIDGGEAAVQNSRAMLDRHHAAITNMTCQLQALQVTAQTVALDHQLLRSLLVTHQQTQQQVATLLQQVAVLQQQVAAQSSSIGAIQQLANRVAHVEQRTSAASSSGQSLTPGSASSSGQGSRPEVIVLQVGAQGPTDLSLLCALAAHFGKSAVGLGKGSVDVPGAPGTSRHAEKRRKLAAAVAQLAAAAGGQRLLHLACGPQPLCNSWTEV